jgi:hypothetical protein
LYHLAASPEYAEPLRGEVQSAVEEHGWTKAALDYMPKLDSFVKESQRFNGVGVGTLLMFVRLD